MTPQNLKRNHLYRQAIAQFFNLHGFPNAEPVTKYKPPHALPGAHGHIAGLPDIEVIAAAITTGRPAETLSEAEQAALDQGKKYGIGVMSRPQRGVEESYVLLTLESFTRLLADLGTKE